MAHDSVEVVDLTDDLESDGCTNRTARIRSSSRRSRYRERSNREQNNDIVEIILDDQLNNQIAIPLPAGSLSNEDKVVDLTEDADGDVSTNRTARVNRIPSRRSRHRLRHSSEQNNVTDVVEITLDDSINNQNAINLFRQSRSKPSPTVPKAQELKCPICIETYVEIKKNGLKTVVTRCGHMFCDFCLKKSLSDNGRKCPKCRKNVPKGPSGIIEIFDVA